MTANSDKKGAPATATPSNSDTVNPTKCPGAAQLVDHELQLWTEVIEIMASTLTLAARIDGKEIHAEEIMNQAAEFANEFMRRRAAMMGGAS